MKKLLSIVCCVMILFTVSSCTKQYITPNPNQTVYANLASTDWTAFTDAAGVKSYRAVINVNQLDDASVKYDGVLIAFSYDDGATYEQLPEVYGNLSYSYIYYNGKIEINAQTADGTTAIQPTDPIKAKIILVYSN